MPVIPNAPPGLNMEFLRSGGLRAPANICRSFGAWIPNWRLPACFASSCLRLGNSISHTDGDPIFVSRVAARF